MISGRVPIIPPFIPIHVAQGGGPVERLTFGDVFDIPRLRKATRSHILEWHEVKNQTSHALDTVGCWNTWEAVQYEEHIPRQSVIALHTLGLGEYNIPHDCAHLLTSKLSDVSYTKAPDSVKLIPNYHGDKHSTFWSLAALSYPEFRNQSLQHEPIPSPVKKEKLLPDEQLYCLDYMYYVCAFHVSNSLRNFRSFAHNSGYRCMNGVEIMDLLGDLSVSTCIGHHPSSKSQTLTSARPLELELVK